MLLSPISPSLSVSLGDTLLSEWRESPSRFFADVFGIEPWTRQREMLEAVATNQRVAVRSGHKVSKSNSAAGLALWWVTCFEEARVVMTSASASQLRRVLWRELRLLYRKAKWPLGGELHDLPDSGLQFPDGREVVGFSTKEPERFAGISGRDVLFLLDEASGIPGTIFEALEGNIAGGGKVGMFGNPIRTSGTFYDAFHDERAVWKTLHISAEESPNVVAGRTVIPGLATKEWVEERREVWGIESPLYQARVQGDFPAQAENAIVPLISVEEARERWDETPAEGRLNLGVDVARFGDDETVIFPRRGRKALEAVVLRGKDNVDVAGTVLEVARRLKTVDEHPLVKVDVIGNGAGVADHLRRSEAVETMDVNVAEASTVTEFDESAPSFVALRDQLWFGMRDWLKDGAIPQDPKLEAELVAPIYGFDTRGRIKVEPKEQIKKRLHRSPDRADALALSIYEPPTPEFGID